MALRPEIVTIGGEGDGNRLSGKIEDVTFLGSIVRIRVKVGEGAGRLSFDTFNNPSLILPKIGDTLALTFPPEACLLLDAAAETPALSIDADEA